ncbi:MAG: hypothetical protein QNJ31_02075 [Candidatus Caenarcaniphilales bacterium]|nr:hypothetical protein [Candidatus Caenarcaniphilales bacterium]
MLSKFLEVIIALEKKIFYVFFLILITFVTSIYSVSAVELKIGPEDKNIESFVEKTNSVIGIDFQGANIQSSNQFSNENCQNLDFCPLCDVVEEWPLDFNGDDFAELAQRRICTQNDYYVSPINGNKNKKIRPEVIIIFSSEGKPVIYKTNLNTCGEELLYSHFQRFDFNKDNLDELMIVERNIKSKDDFVSVLGFDFTKNRIVELPILDYERAVTEQLIANKRLEEKIIEEYEKLNGSRGFILKGKTQQEKRIFRVYYIQHRQNRSFHPVKITYLKS